MLDPRYVVATNLTQVFVDKTTGAPLAGGTIQFWEDDARTVPKLVYALTGSPPNYTYTPLPNPITLSATGQVLDAAGNYNPIYYFPYDAQGNIQLYFIRVLNAQGTEQQTYQAWPNLSDDANQNLNRASISNQLSNPQFSSVLFDPTTPWVITISGASTTGINIGGGWGLTIVTSGASTVTVVRNSIAGTAALPFNPPYTLTITPGANITSLVLTQQLFFNPNIWSPQPGGQNGYLAASILLAPLSSVAMQYAPNIGPVQSLLNANNLTGVYTQFRNTVQLTPPANTSTPETGMVNINLVISNSLPTTFSNVQVVNVETNEQNIAYDQTTINRQTDYLFHYYQPMLNFKPIPSYLVGWDFSLNPAQFKGTTVAPIASGANTSNYFWDQTIVFQSTNNSIGATKDNRGALNLTATADTQIALVQYLPFTENGPLEMLVDHLCSMVEGYTDNVGGLGMNVSMWVSNDASLPNMGASASLVATLSATGKPATLNGNWTEIPRGLYGDANFTMSAANGTTGKINNNISLSQWQYSGTFPLKWFAIVVGTKTLTSGKKLVLQSVSVQQGDIPTTPAPNTYAQALQRCQSYYEKSFDVTQIPQNNLGINSGETLTSQVLGAATALQLIGTISYKTPKFKDASIITTYNPMANNGEAWDETIGVQCSAIALIQQSFNGFSLTTTTAAGSAVGDIIGIHWTSDARLGF